MRPVVRGGAAQRMGYPVRSMFNSCLGNRAVPSNQLTETELKRNSHDQGRFDPSSKEQSNESNESASAFRSAFAYPKHSSVNSLEGSSAVRIS